MSQGQSHRGKDRGTDKGQKRCFQTRFVKGQRAGEAERLRKAVPDGKRFRGESYCANRTGIVDGTVRGWEGVGGAVV